MADKRKLQGEIDRCLKRVAEGLEQFDDIWQKVHNAANANQKEKYEADLKKEIKKLQRLRDQIKTWLTSNEIKDKRPLVENRKLIETRMERFKVVERETKTKAYSKEGLGQVSKVDPEQKKKEEVRQWLTTCIDNLNRQIDEFEAEIESLYAGSKKKKLDRDKNDRVEELMAWVERHKFHVQKLETIMRLLDNCSLDPESVRDIQDDINYYLDCNQEPDFTENELIYDDLDLDEAQSGMYSSTALPIPAGAAPPHTLTQAEEEVNSIPSSPSASSQGPLSPKTPTTMKSTSQELFEERRRGKTTSVSSIDQNEMHGLQAPQSPRKPVPNTKAILPNSVGSPTGSHIPSDPLSSSSSSSSATSSVKPNSLPVKSSSAPLANLPTSAPPTVTSAPVTPATSAVAGSSMSNGSQKTTPKLAMSPWGQSCGNSPSLAQSPLMTASPTTALLGQPLLHTAQPVAYASGGIPSAVSGVMAVVTGHPHISTSSPSSQPQQQPRPPALGSGQSQHSRSSSNSSISSMALSQDSAHQQPHSHSTVMAGVAHSLTNSGAGHYPGPGVSASSAYESSTATSATCGTESTGSAASAQAHSQGSAPSSSGSPRVLMETDHAHMGIQPPPFSPGGGATQQKQSGTPPVPPSPSGSSLSSAQHWMTPLETVSGAVPHSPAPHLTSAEAAMFTSAVGIMSWLPPTTAGSMLTAAALSEASSSVLPLQPTSSTATGFVTSSVGGSPTAPANSSPPSSPFSSALLATPPPSSTSSFPHSTLLTMHTQAPLLTSSQGLSQPESSAVSSDSAHQSSAQEPQQLSSLKDIAAEVVAASSGLSSGHHDDQKDSTNSIIRPLLDPGLATPGERLDVSSLQRTDTQLQPLLGVTPLGPMQLSQEKLYQLKMLEAGCKHMPQPADSERVRPYLQRSPCPTPSFHHQHPPPHFDSFEFFQRLSIEALFFIFYYMEGTKAQYMAAKALKKLSWRFHTKYMMWFQRLEEPKAITDDYEMGTYIYFDFEKWSQRKKEGFTFEYRYLEDKDLP